MKLADIRAQILAIRAELDALVTALTDAEAKRDQFVLHVFKAREALRQAKENKQDSRSPKITLPTFRKAVELGFQGSPGEWDTVVRAGITTYTGGKMNLLQQAQERAVAAGRPEPPPSTPP